MSKRESPEFYQFRLPCPLKLAETPEGKKLRPFEGVAYSGEVLQHPYRDRAVVFDIGGMRTVKPRIPALINHDPNQRAGHTALTFGDSVTIDNGLLLHNEHGEAVASESDAGFPWDMSVYIRPGSVEEVQAGQSITVNGREMQGPLDVFHNSIIREVSFCPCGVDPETSALAASDHQSTPKRQPEVDQKTFDEMKASLESQLADERAKVTALNTERDTLRASLQAEQDARKAQERAARFADVQATLKALGRDVKEEKEVEAYLVCSADVWQTVKADLQALKPKPSAEMFSEGFHVDPQAKTDAQALVDRMVAM